jgi:ribosomal protein L27
MKEKEGTKYTVIEGKVKFEKKRGRKIVSVYAEAA